MIHKHKIPVILGRTASFSLTELKSLGLFNQVERYCCMPVAIKSHNGLKQSTDTILVTVSLQEGNCYILLSYQVNGQQMDYRLPLVMVQSNLRLNGGIWYVLCPITNKRSRKLYLIGKHFVGLKAIQYKMYPQQAMSRKQRNIYRLMSQVNKCNRIIKGGSVKYHMPRYNDAITKRQARINKAKEQLTRISQVLQA